MLASNGNIVYSGIRGVPDSTRVNEMWDVLGDIPLELTDSDKNSTEDASGRILDGAITVRIKHVDRVLASVALEHLELRSISGKWSLDAAEVSRIKKSAQK